MVDPSVSSRLNMRKRQAKRHGTVANFSNAEIARAIERAQQRLQEDPHAGLRQWLAALIMERDRRTRRG